MVAGIALGATVPALVNAIAAAEVARVNLVVAVLIWAMVYPMMVGVRSGSLRDVVKQPKGLAITLIRQLADQALHHGRPWRAVLRGGLCTISSRPRMRSSISRG